MIVIGKISLSGLYSHVKSSAIICDKNPTPPIDVDFVTFVSFVDGTETDLHITSDNQSIVNDVPSIIFTDDDSMLE